MQPTLSETGSKIEASPSVARPTDYPTCHGGFENLDQEFDYWIEDLEGDIPKDLRGTFFRNGPGRQSIGGMRYGHWFDGDGMVCRYTFTDNGSGEGGVHFSNRYVRTPKYIEETRDQAIRFRGFGTQIPGGWRNNIFRMPTNPANTSLIYHGERLLALNESGRPWELDPGSLDTLGEYDYGGALRRRSFSAHGKVLEDTGEYINFGAGISGWRRRPCLNLYRIDRTGRVSGAGRVLLDAFPFCHDFALTKSHAVFFLSSIIFRGIGDFLLGKTSLADGIGFDPEQPMRVLVVALDTLEVVRDFEMEPGTIVHFANAFEHGNTIVIDALYSDSFDADVLADMFAKDLHIGGGRLMRYELDMDQGSISASCLSEHECEFPTYNTRLTGRPYKVCYTACSVPNGADSFYNGFQRVSAGAGCELVTLPPGFYGSEPLFAPAVGGKSEDDGYLLVVVYNAFKHRSALHVYRADNPNDLVCRLNLPHHVPHQFHGYFSDRIFL